MSNFEWGQQYRPKELNISQKVGAFLDKPPQVRLIAYTGWGGIGGACTDIRGYGLTNRTEVIMSWNVGFTYDGEEETILEEEVSFKKGINVLYRYVGNLLKRNENNEDVDLDAYEVLLADISDIKDDPGIMDDSDQWEDEDFYGPGITLWLVEN